MQYYRIDPDRFGNKWAYALPYTNCLNYNHDRQEAYCPLCNRGVGGSVWVGPFNVYLSSLKMPNIMYGTNFDVLWDESTVAKFQESQLKGIECFQKFEVFYKGKAIDWSYFAPIFAYSAKKFSYAKKLNEQRKQNKSLPKCSLCKKSNDGLSDLYFDDVYEYDIFKIYECPGELFCNERFKKFCEYHAINNILDFMRPIVK